MIGGYSFGHIEVAGKRYSSDIIIYPDGRVKDSWWRKAGHTLCLDDIAELVSSAPEVIVAGTGAFGLMRPEDGLAEDLARRGIALEAAPSKKACSRFNELRAGARVGACFHLTC